MQVRCNQCMAIFEEEEIKVRFDEEICPKCYKSGALMDLDNDKINAINSHLNAIADILADSSNTFIKVYSGR